MFTIAVEYAFEHHRAAAPSRDARTLTNLAHLYRGILARLCLAIVAVLISQGKSCRHCRAVSVGLARSHNSSQVSVSLKVETSDSSYSSRPKHGFGVTGAPQPCPVVNFELISDWS